ncbi:MAG: hypothetical protein R8L58_04895 [Mariprofundaceae bacterium]
MSTLARHASGERVEFLKWVSERNSHVPMSLLEFLIDTPPYIPEDDDFSGCDFDEEEYLRS